MAHLINESGYRDLVTRVARDNNFVYINDIKEGPVIDWIKQSGLTQAEAAQIQPSYDHMYTDNYVCDPTHRYYSGDAICDPTLFNVLYHYLPNIFAITLSCLITWCLYKLASWTMFESKLKRYSSKVIFYSIFLLFWVLLSFISIKYLDHVVTINTLVEYIDTGLLYSFIILCSGCIAGSLILLPKTMWHSNNIWKRRYAFSNYFFISLTICLPVVFGLFRFFDIGNH